MTTETTDIVKKVEASPELVLTDSELRLALFEHIEGEIRSFVPNLETATGRKEVASLAYKIARTKTAVDDAGKAINAELRKKINEVDEQRREIRTRLDGLRDAARLPLTEWEEAEKAREAEAKSLLDLLLRHAVVRPDETSTGISLRIVAVEALHLDESILRDRYDEAVALRETALDTMSASFVRVKREEAEREELARLRKLDEERTAKEQAEREAREAEERKKADEERHEREKAEAVERARQEEQLRIAAEEQRKKDEEAKRAADKKHRAKVMIGAAAALVTHAKLSMEQAQATVDAIVAGDVPGVEIRF